MGHLFFQQRGPQSVSPENVLKRDDVIEYLKEFQSKFVITLVDKTTNNFAFVCKKFYICSILKELGLWPGEEGLTYKKSNLNRQEVINKLRGGSDLFLKNERAEDIHYELPFIYAIVKMHKNPIKLRFIIASCKSPNKTLARVAMLGLDACEKQLERFCEHIRNFTGINRFFIINNFQKISSDIETLNSRPSEKQISTFDFTSLYTKLTHERLKNNMEWYIDTAFKGAKLRGQKFLSVYHNSTRWVSKHNENSNSFDCATFKCIIKSLVDNVFFEFGEFVMRQIIGIPMGHKHSPQMANGTLHKEEYFFQEQMTKTNYLVAKSLNHTFRYIDDITPLNDKGNFEKYFTQIYPPELELNRENVGFKSATVLEMDVNVVDNKFLVGVYDKRDSFNFEVFRYPSFESNIPNRIIYSVFLGQLVRFSRVCNFEEGFVTATKLLIRRLVQKGAKVNILRAYVVKFFGKYRVPYTTKEAFLAKIFNP